jgi:hypothetical protein
MTTTITRAQELTAQLYALMDAIEETTSTLEYHRVVTQDAHEIQQQAGILSIQRQHLQIVRRNMQS